LPLAARIIAIVAGSTVARSTFGHGSPHHRRLSKHQQILPKPKKTPAWPFAATSPAACSSAGDLE
jgi:hypothetical protein